jgi:CO/xanthine dehydrogenase Mo-binding subunit
MLYPDIEATEPVVTFDAARAGRILVHPASGRNVAERWQSRRGDATAAFARAAYTRRESFRCHRHSSVPLETRGLVARWDAARGHLEVLGAAKVPHFNRDVLAGMLGLDPSQVDLVELDVGGSFGARGEFYPEDLLIPAAARLTGVPIKWIEDRRENLIAMNHAREMACDLEIAADRDGRILALRGTLVADMGARTRHALSESTKGAQDRLEAERLGIQAYLDFVRTHQALYRVVMEAQFVAPEAYRDYYRTFAAAYRQQLRDITTQPGFPYQITWPVPPVE